MHSRIFQIERNPVTRSNCIDSSSIPEWFVYSIADYTSDECDRDHDIEWLMSGALNGVASTVGDKLIFSSCGVEEYFKDKHGSFVKAAEKLSKVSLIDFISKRDVGSLFDLKEAYDDKYGFYVYTDDDLITLDEFMRGVKDGETYFFGGVVDYHF